MDEILILSKINSNGISAKYSPCNIVSICDEIITKYNEIQDDGRTSFLIVNGEERLINLDKNLFEHAFSNMVSNAFKYSKKNPAPEVSITFNADTVVLKVKDFGIGIPDNDLKNLFTPFFRGSNAMDIPGTGLGTAILKEYIELNNGQVSVESEVNVGTTFNVILKN
jgi:signal transduction histidine kinase